MSNMTSRIVAKIDEDYIRYIHSINEVLLDVYVDYNIMTYMDLVWLTFGLGLHLAYFRGSKIVFKYKSNFFIVYYIHYDIGGNVCCDYM